MIKKLFLILLLCGAFPLLGVTRAAFDLGSGHFKVMVAEVEEGKVSVLFSKMVSVAVAADLEMQSDRTLSPKIQEVALKALNELKAATQPYNPEEFSGVATAAFRLAKNGEQVVAALSQKSGIPLYLISQKKEGELGFNTALVLSPEINESNLLAWDSGGASFQLTVKNLAHYTVFDGPIGNTTTTKLFLEEVRKVPYSKDIPLNPISYDETVALKRALQKKIGAPPLWLKHKLANPKTTVVAIGDKNTIFALGARGTNTSTFTLPQINDLIKKLAGSSNDELRSLLPSNPDWVLTRLTLLQAVMEHFNIQRVTYKEATGNTLGIMIDDTFWN